MNHSRRGSAPVAVTPGLPAYDISPPDASGRCCGGTLQPEHGPLCSPVCHREGSPCLGHGGAELRGVDSLEGIQNNIKNVNKILASGLIQDLRECTIYGNNPITKLLNYYPKANLGLIT